MTTENGPGLNEAGNSWVSFLTTNSQWHGRRDWIYLIMVSTSTPGFISFNSSINSVCSEHPAQSFLVVWFRWTGFEMTSMISISTSTSGILEGQVEENWSCCRDSGDGFLAERRYKTSGMIFLLVGRDDFRRIFEKFSRSSSWWTRDVTGQNLGISFINGHYNTGPWSCHFLSA